MSKDQRKEAKLQSLQVQREFLASLRTRHLTWANDIDNHEMTKLHFEIIDLLRQTGDKYNILLEMYNNKIEMTHN